MVKEAVQEGNMIAENYKLVEQRVADACKRSGRSREEVTLIAVSKTKPVEMVRELAAIGVKDFGENKAQELVMKTAEIPTPLNWHFIGHLQRNKVKYVVDKACLIHSVSSLRLAEEIQREAEKRGILSKVLVEVNIAEEETKMGISEEEVIRLVKAVAVFPNLQIQGLMAIAPPVAQPEENRKYFQELKRLQQEIAALKLPGTKMEELSMGMTGDFEVAIEEGATMVRVGTAIFGER